MKKIFYILFLLPLFAGAQLYLQCPPSLNCVPNITLAGGIAGSGTLGFIPRFTGPQTIGDSWLGYQTNYISIENGKYFTNSSNGGASLFLDNGATDAVLLSTDAGAGVTPHITLDGGGTQIINGSNIITGSTSGITILTNTLSIINGTEGADKVLTSNANGVATWQTPASTTVLVGPGLGVTHTGNTYSVSLSAPNFKTKTLTTRTITSAAPSMLGTSFTITPTKSGTIVYNINFSLATVSGTEFMEQILIKTGTGTPPNPLAAVTGTSQGVALTGAGTPGSVPLSVSYIITGLTLNTAYWIDVATQGDDGLFGDINTTGINISAFEL